jgi:hypothetical protein
VKGSHALLLISIASCVLNISTASISSAYLSDFAQNYTEYRGEGISIEYPQGWLASASGEEYSGNLSIIGSETWKMGSGESKRYGSRTQGSGACIFLTWMRDPGIAPEKVLDQVESAYGGDEMKILSSKRGSAKVAIGQASTLALGYSFKNYNTTKLFAVWNSSLSDRLFFATYSVGNGVHAQNPPQNASVFYHMMESFIDLPERKATALLQRSEKGDAWAVVLGDLLGSYSYRDTRPLPPGKISLQTVCSLLPSNGGYQLSSRDQLSAESPRAIMERAGAVQGLLNRAGYITRLISARGNIWVAVRDASQRWQTVSLNPIEPKRMVGVLIDNVNVGIVYENISDLSSNDPIEFDEGNISKNYNIINNSIGSIVQKDCEPSSYVDLAQPSPENMSWMSDLKKVLDGYNYGHSYKENLFDCSNTSQICCSLLHEKGYDARLMMSYKGHPLDPHMWVLVRYPYETKGWVAVETANTDKNMNLIHLGRITEKEDYYRGIMYNSSIQFSRLHPEEGMWLKS